MGDVSHIFPVTLEDSAYCKGIDGVLDAYRSVGIELSHREREFFITFFDPANQPIQNYEIYSTKHTFLFLWVSFFSGLRDK
jgi:hypothetical protein